jgi:hypothetical protein
MPDFAFAIPVAPDKEEVDRQTFHEMEGPRRQEYEQALQAAGITRHAVWHQQTPDGTIAVVVVEADDPEAAADALGKGDATFNSWFRAQMQEVHGVDISAGTPPSEKVHDIRV